MSGRRDVGPSILVWAKECKVSNLVLALKLQSLAGKLGVVRGKMSWRRGPTPCEIQGYWLPALVVGPGTMEEKV